MTVMAKFKVDYVETDDGGQTQVLMSPVYHANDPTHPNAKFWAATPSGSLSMVITNPGVGGFFEMNAVYTLTFEPEAIAEPPESDDVTETAPPEA